MRKRQDLDTRISAVLRLEQTIEDNVGLIELGDLKATTPLSPKPRKP